MTTRFASLLAATVAACGAAATAPTPAAPPPPARDPLTLTYFGVAGWQLDGGGARVLVDPYFSRIDPASDAPLEPDLPAIAARAPDRADLILIGHAHVDHVFDAPTVATRTGAELIGSDATIRLARASGVPDAQLVQVGGGEDYAWPSVSVRVIPSLHSALGDKHHVEAPMPDPVRLPMRFSDYAAGATLAYLVRLGGHQVFVLSTANFIEREVAGLRPDVAIIAPGLRQQVHDYTCRLLGALGHPPVVLATHFDDWHAPPQIGAPIDDDTAAFVAEVQACAPGTRVIVPTPFAPITLP
jgi:L-ascorbate metabolism protein UlaG (beta-lactamase superfamily)